jgi:[ribosomal protein S5]-alanine N-acetyltransferase
VTPPSSARLTFRSWTDKDTALAETLWCDPEVTRYCGGAMTREQARSRLDIERECENRRYIPREKLGAFTCLPW